ncbi:DUF4352 domain-containing protein [Actinomadura flavalba]|uniref:DUF4352 domain-containing protein n=1 Tax=Actinomadura flavalba TaxID=1120938 RepID=UPI00038050BA|nr:DUF4352 domain-containing protein [Actinomadura flavalba]
MPERIAPVLAALALALTGCSGDPGGTRDAAPTYPLAARTVRPGESAVRAAPVTGGELRFQVIGLTAGLTTLAGSHADRAPRGRYVRVRLVVENTGRTGQRLDVRAQRLRTADGAAHARDLQATLIKRQPADTLDLGAGMRTEMDLWFDIPAATQPAALRLVGTAPLGAVTAEAPPVEVPLR